MKELKPTKMWCVVGRQGYFNLDTLSYWKRDCIASFINGGNITWDEYRKKYGWKAIKVLVTIQKVK
jgi:hypothetical protein